MIFNQYSRVEGDRGAEEGEKWDLSEGGKPKQKSKREFGANLQRFASSGFVWLAFFTELSWKGLCTR